MRKVAFCLSLLAALALISIPALAGSPERPCDCAKAAAKADGKTAKADCKPGCKCEGCKKATAAHKADCQCEGGKQAKAADPGCGGCPKAGSHPDCPHAKKKSK